MLILRLKRTIKLGAKSLWMHRLRSTLTTLGIVFGVCSVVAMLAIGEGASKEAQDQIAKLGSRNIILRSVKPAESPAARSSDIVVESYGLTYADADRVRRTVPHVTEVIPKRLVTCQAIYRNRTISVQLIGTVPWYPDVHPLQVLRGRFFTGIDSDYQQKAAVVDEQIVEQLFAVDDPLRTDIKLAGRYYTVVGVASAAGPGPAGNGTQSRGRSAGSAGGVAGNIYIPLSAFRQSFGEMRMQNIGGARQAERVELQEVTVKVDSADFVLSTREVLEALLLRFHKKKDYQIIVPLELLNQAARTKWIFNIVLGSIAAISLLVGGIGIMNIMLATVSERTREIGIRRALGATRRDIVIQFLSETLLLTLTGGLLGIALGVVVPVLVTQFGKMPTIVTGESLALAFGISATIGVAFGLYPAYRAAHMDPIESLRHE